MIVRRSFLPLFPRAIAAAAIVLHAARMLDVESGKIIAPGEILVQGERIAGVGPGVSASRGQRRSSTSAT